MLTLNPPASGQPVDVVLSAPPDTPLPELARTLAAAVGVPESRAPDLEIADGTGLRAGAVVSFGSRGGAPAPRARVAELRVVGGPDAGMVVPLSERRTLVGRGSDAGVRLRHDGNASRHHAFVYMHGGGVAIEDAGSTNGTWIDGRRIQAPAAVREGQVIRVGDSLLGVALPRAPGGSVAPDSDGTVAFNRPPRIVPPRPRRRIAVPARPEAREGARFPLITTIAPLVLGVAMAAILSRPEYLLFTLLSPVIAAGNYISERRRGAESSRGRQETYRAAVTQANADLEQALAEELRARRAVAPDPAEILATATGLLPRLWERRPADADAIELRVGVADRPPETELSPAAGQAPPPLPPLDAVPVSVPLREVGVLGIAGPRARGQALGRWLVAQAATLHSPRELSIVVLAGSDGERPWSWTRWLPHTRPRDGS
ncbi:MAG: segregation ATPase FtsK/SpoIIIE, family, partial [Thermoleophilaceae bacterium]|nr:segregation ATPase FtsK/SpoIIIE, family [Thermoleophilaceae bacterium]